MKGFIFCLAMFFAVTASAFEVPVKHRVPNRSPGYCTWAALETLGRCHNIKNLFNLVESRTKDEDVTVDGEVKARNFGYDWAVKAKLDALKVKYSIQYSGGKNRDLLKYANEHGCVVSFKAEGLKLKTDHSVLLTRYDDKVIEYYDSNHPKHIYKGNREWFDLYWNGDIIVVFENTK